MKYEVSLEPIPTPRTTLVIYNPRCITAFMKLTLIHTNGEKLPRQYRHQMTGLTILVMRKQAEWDAWTLSTTTDSAGDREGGAKALLGHQPGSPSLGGLCPPRAHTSSGSLQAGPLSLRVPPPITVPLSFSLQRGELRSERAPPST